MRFRFFEDYAFSARSPHTPRGFTPRLIRISNANTGELVVEGTIVDFRVERSMRFNRACIVVVSTPNLTPQQLEKLTGLA
jgi:hypothetical protein